MTPYSIHLFYDNDGKPKSAYADIFVPGLGKMSIENAISDNLSAIVSAASVEALRVKLEQKITVEPKEFPDGI